MLLSLINIVAMLANLLSMFVFVYVVLSLLLSFNVLNRSNQFVDVVWRGVSAVLDPLLNPIRRILPSTGGIDFSPLVLIVGLWILQELLAGVARDTIAVTYS